MSINIVKAKPLAPTKFIILGEPFSGKTTLASKAPRPLFISTDGNAAKMGLDAVNVEDLQTVRDAVTFFTTSPDYDTLVIDTIEGIADLFEKAVIEQHQVETKQPIQALTDVPYGRLTGQFNRRIANFAETLWSLPKNVIVLTYTKRQVDDISGNIILASELKSIRQFTRFADGMILCSFDGDKYEARVISKRTVVQGEVEYGTIEGFLSAAGWALPPRRVKVGSTKK